MKRPVLLKHLALCLMSAITVLVLVIFSTPAYTQTDITINANAPDLESEYRKELDKWMLQAYEGDRDAQFRVGVLFTNEQFRRPDYEQAVYWYKQAARQGHILAQYNLGHQYLTGVGVKRNENTAMNWWLKAAEQDHPLAQFNIGRAYYLGIGLKEDHDQSRLWFERAARNHEPKSIDILEQLGWAEPGQYTRKTPSEDDILANNRHLSQGINNNEFNTPAPSTVETTVDKADSSAQVLRQENPTPSAAAVATPATEENSPDSTSDNKSAAQSIAVYTDPEIRSVLITIVDSKDQLNVISKDEEWTVVKSEIGFPVWVHSRFILVADDIGTITASDVNARSVPIITNGTIVGQLDRNETVAVLDKHDTWYRVTSPRHFQAWVKTEDFSNNSSPSQDPIIAKVDMSDHDSVNDNEWLFKQPADNYTLQLGSFDDPEKIKEFMSREKFIDNPKLHRFTARSDAIEWTYFLYGSYYDSSSAKSEREEIKQQKAWIRRFGKLQQNRCVAWKKQIPTPKELNKYCT